MSLAPIHRVVTGHDANGRAIIASNGPLPSVVEMQAVPGMIFHEVWETRGAPVAIGNESDPTAAGLLDHHPPAQNTIIRFVDLPPDATYVDEAASRMNALFDELDNVEGLTVKSDSPHPMMHRSETLDYGIVIEGEMTLVLDDSEVQLKSGSVVVQRGTNHAWANRTDKTCRMLFVQLGGRYEPEIAAALAQRGRAGL